LKEPFALENNLILKGLPPEVADRLRIHLEPLEVPLKMPIYGQYEKIRHIYFLLNSVASIVATTAAGESTEIGIVGFEGAVGTEILMGVDASPHQCFIQIAGPALRIGIKPMLAEFRRGGVLHDRMLNFVNKLSVQVSQTTLCNRLHHIEQRLPRWLLMSHDRVRGDVLPLTQEFIALMLGTSRVTVTRASRKFQHAGFIKYVRGRITVTDRRGLEKAACECYSIVRAEYDRKMV
jgi:CRP-like cAMP-binding protein